MDFNLLIVLFMLESELVSGFMTEHSAVIFVFFFLAEYASIVFMCILISTLFLGGYLYDLISLTSLLDIYIWSANIFNIDPYIPVFNKGIILEAIIYSLSLGLKTSVMVFIFIWVRASFPRIRYDQLMSYCWTVLLPLVIAMVIIVPCILYNLDTMPLSICL